MHLLDCTNRETALETLSRLAGISATELEDRLRGVTVDRSFEMHHGEPMVMAVFGGLDRVPQPDSVCWFHATRVPRGTDFADGLLPTQIMMPRLESCLRELAVRHGLCSESRWDRLHRTGHDAWRLRQKAGSSPADKGPHGFLMRDTIVFKIKHPDDSRVRDYTRVPEIVHEICGAIQPKIGHPLKDAYRAATLPAIVKFKSSEYPDGTVAAALAYLHAMIVEGEWAESYGFDWQGVAIPAEDVLAVERL